MPWRRPLYRARQFLHALYPMLDASHLAHARSILNDGEMRLFLTMERRDQRHGLRVLHHLLAEGQDDHDLLAAALIHDCGKGRAPLRLRTTNVAAPWLVRAWAGEYAWCREPARGLARRLGVDQAAYRLVHHARLGAELAQRSGSSAATVRYISGSAAEHERDKISLLRAADDRS